ncbi:MAG: MaoC family dehydratase [Cytophagaceae bacterium]|jgi:3-hydroxybutyryl-CoA dehydratase|nr:MaoC family dehydratase [Cytophagaceae bacterium]
MLYSIGDTFEHEFTYTQEQVNAFAELSGDKNPIHIDPAYAANTPFKKPIVHGIFSMAVISKVMGMEFPGEGTVYLKQVVEFKRPIYMDTKYKVQTTFKEVNRDKHTAIVTTNIVDATTNKIHLQGEATIFHPTKI